MCFFLSGISLVLIFSLMILIRGFQVLYIKDLSWFDNKPLGLVFVVTYGDWSYFFFRDRVLNFQMNNITFIQDLVLPFTYTETKLHFDLLNFNPDLRLHTYYIHKISSSLIN